MDSETSGPEKVIIVGLIMIYVVDVLVLCMFFINTRFDQI